MPTSTPSTQNTIEFCDIRVSISGTEILTGATACVPNGSCTAIVGPNGAGKTTLLLALLGQVPYTGRIIKNNQKPGSKIRFGYVPQRMTFDRNMPLTVLEFMAIGKQRSPIWFGVRKKFRNEARELLKAVQAEKLIHRRIGALSGGEMQRVLLSLALEQNPELLILDEATAGVDLQGARIFCDLLDDLREKYQFTQLMVNHDLSTVTHHATHVICLNKRVIIQGVPHDVLTTQTLTELFGLHMGLVKEDALSCNNGNCTGACCNKGEGNV